MNHLSTFYQQRSALCSPIYWGQIPQKVPGRAPALRRGAPAANPWGMAQDKHEATRRADLQAQLRCAPCNSGAVVCVPLGLGQHRAGTAAAEPPAAGPALPAAPGRPRRFPHAPMSPASHWLPRRPRPAAAVPPPALRQWAGGTRRCGAPPPTCPPPPLYKAAISAARPATAAAPPPARASPGLARPRLAASRHGRCGRVLPEGFPRRRGGGSHLQDGRRPHREGQAAAAGERR